jgi:hypothetical protein
MWIRLTKALYPGEGVEEDEEVPRHEYLVIECSGCGCCSVRKKLTPELLKEAIEEASGWLDELNGIDPRTLEQ